MQYWSKGAQTCFRRKRSYAIFLDLPGPTLHKKISLAMLTYCPQTTLLRKIIFNFVWIYLGQHCIRKLLAQCWPRADRYTFEWKPAFSDMSGDLFFLTGYIIIEQSWLFLFNDGSGVHLRLADRQWTGGDIDWNTYRYPCLISSLEQFRGLVIVVILGKGRKKVEVGGWEMITLLYI